MVGRGVAAGLEVERGSSFDRESLRDDDTPEADNESDLLDDVGVEDARDASSSESRTGWVDGVLRFP